MREGVVFRSFNKLVQYLLIMADVLTKKQRSYNMSQIKGKNTKPEVSLRKLLFANGVRSYRIHYKLIGKPDVVFSKKKIAIFIDGCFWHKCPQCFIEPETRKKFWDEKINGNIKRDREVNKALKSSGWKVLRFWEHSVRKSPDKIVSKIMKEIGLD